MPSVIANGIELYYETSGPPTGEPLLLIMGLGSQLVMWPAGFVDGLVSAGYYVIRFDNRDVGLSQKMEDADPPNIMGAWARRLIGLRVEAPYTLSDMAADAAGLIEAVGVKSAHVFGVSLGGMVAQTMAIEHPERVRSMTSMMSTPGSSRFVGHPRAVVGIMRRPVSKTPEEAADNSVAFFNVLRGPGYEVDEKILRPAAAKAFQRCYYPPGFRRQMLAVIASGDRTPALRQVQCPALIIHGSHDPLVPVAAGRATAKAIPGARLHIIEGLGHHMPSGIWTDVIEQVQMITKTAKAQPPRPRRQPDEQPS